MAINKQHFGLNLLHHLIEILRIEVVFDHMEALASILNSAKELFVHDISRQLLVLAHWDQFVALLFDDHVSV